MGPRRRIPGLAVLVCLFLCLACSPAFASPVLPDVAAPATCSDTVAGELPCTWTAGVNAYPGNSDSFQHKGVLSTAGQLISSDRFDTVVIDVPISAANYTDAHVEMPTAGEHEVYNCSSSNATYYSPTAKEVVAIGRRVLAADAKAVVVIRPMLALGGSCNSADYYPTGKFYGSGYTNGASNEIAFSHFYTAILLRLASDAGAIHHPGHVVLDDATGLDCLYDDPNGAGYVGYFNSLPGQISSRYPHLAQMFSIDWNFADSATSSCGWPKSHTGSAAVNELNRDKTFLSEVGIVGIQANFPLTGGDDSVSSVFSRWSSTDFTVKGASATNADGLVQDLHSATGADVVMSAIGYNDCANNPAADPTVVPSWCNKIYGHEQGVPDRAEVTAEQNADVGAYCFWSTSEGASDPWFLGLWWWNRDFDFHPYVNPYDLTWGNANLGTSAMAALRGFQRGSDAGTCPASSAT